MPLKVPRRAASQKKAAPSKVKTESQSSAAAGNEGASAGSTTEQGATTQMTARETGDILVEAVQDEADTTAGAPQEQSQPYAQGFAPTANMEAGNDEDPPSEPLQPPPLPAPHTIATTTEQAPSSTAPSPGLPPSSRTPSVQRLDSLTHPSIGSPAPGPSTRGSIARGRGRGRGMTAKTPVAAPKFAGRRSQASRLEAEKAELERKRVEAEARAKEAARRARGRGGPADRGRVRGRGRGGYVGERERERDREMVASGPFSAGAVSADAGKRRVVAASSSGGGGGGTYFGGGGGGGGVGGGGGGGGGGGSGGGSKVKSETGGFVDGDGDYTMIKTEDGGYVSSDEDEGVGAQRQNVDDLVIIDLTGDDNAATGALQAFAPVRLKREVHKDRTLGLNADGAAAAVDGALGNVDIGGHTDGAASASGGAARRSKGKGRAGKDDVQFAGQGQTFQATYSSSDEQEPVIKDEPRDEDDAAVATDLPEATTAITHPPDPPSSPESKRKAKEQIKSRALSGTLAAPQRPVYQTQEEVDEWDRRQEDLRVLRSELGVLSVAPPPPPATADKDGDASMTNGEAEAGSVPIPPVTDKRADKVYLFQFPPVLPDLESITVKAEPEGASAPTAPDAMAVDQPPATATALATAAGAKSKGAPPPQTAQKLPAGLVGKLRIHASGRATLDWGGTPLTLGMGTTATFLQDVLIAELPEGKKGDTEGEAASEGKRGVAMAMGQVKGKFVVTPDWEEILR